MGHTTLHASYWFDQANTPELSAELHTLAKSPLQDRRNITCLHGKSADALPTLSGPSSSFSMRIGAGMTASTAPPCSALPAFLQPQSA